MGLVKLEVSRCCFKKDTGRRSGSNVGSREGKFARTLHEKCHFCVCKIFMSSYDILRAQNVFWRSTCKIHSWLRISPILNFLWKILRQPPLKLFIYSEKTGKGTKADVENHKHLFYFTHTHVRQINESQKWSWMFVLWSLFLQWCTGFWTRIWLCQPKKWLYISVLDIGGDWSLFEAKGRMFFVVLMGWQ